ncbi:4715_t:CDS:2, partial [Racocetra fulgida]
KNRHILCQLNEDHLARESLIELDVLLEDNKGEIGIDSQLKDNEIDSAKGGIGIDSQLGDDEGGILEDNKGQLESWTEDILKIEEINNQ